MNHHAPERPAERGGDGLRQRARDELQSYLVVSGYLFLCFSALVMFKAALLREDGFAFLPHGVAVVKSLILGKFILLGEAAGLGERHARGTSVARAIAIRSVLFFLLLIVLSVLEEVLVGLVHGQTLAQTMAHYREHGVLVLLTTSWLLLLVLVPWIAFAELSRALGPGGMRRLLAGPRA